jgi:hypothetical protein
MKKILMIILVALVANCAHPPSAKIDDTRKAELAEKYPITGISFTEFEYLIRDIKEHIPPDSAVLSIGISKHDNVAYVMTGRIESFGGSGAEYISPLSLVA